MNTPAIQLRLINAGGRRIDRVWAVLLARPGIPLPLPVGGLSRHAPLLAWENDRWMLRNPATDLCLRVNDAPLGAHAASPITAGDEIEAGICRYRVEPAEAHWFAAAESNEPASEEAATARGQRPALPVTLPLPGFDDDAILGDDPFAVLPAGLPAGIDADLGDAVPAAADSSRSAVETGNEDDAADREIARLAQAYRRALIDPDARLATEFANVVGDGGVPRMVDDGSLSLEELVTRPLDVDSLVKSFDDYGTGQLLVADEGEDILDLFAGILPSSVRRPPPRSRQDHHLISLYSDYRAGGTTPVEDDTPPD